MVDFDFNAAVNRDKKEKDSIVRSLNGSADGIKIDIAALHEDLKDFAESYAYGSAQRRENGGRGFTIRMSSDMLDEIKIASMKSQMPINVIALIGLRWAVAHIDEIGQARKGVPIFGDVRDEI